MNKLLLCCVVVLGTGCSKKRIAECDALLETAEKITRCEKLPADGRKTVGEATKTIRDSLKMLEDAGGTDNAPDDLVNQMRDLCKTSNKTFVDQYTQIAPECLK